MANGSGLKASWGVEEPAPSGSDHQAKVFKKGFCAVVEPMADRIGYMSVHAPQSVHAGMTAKSGKLYQAYQKVAKSIDPTNPKKAQGPIKKVLQAAKDTDTKYKSEAEKTKAAHEAWLAKQPAYESAASELDTLETWGDGSADPLLASTGAIDGKAGERHWADATQLFDAFAAALRPLYDAYLRQLEAKGAYDQQRPAFDGAFATACANALPSERMEQLIAQIETQLGAIDAFASQKDYIAALEQLEGLADLMGDLEAECDRLAELQRQYETLARSLLPRVAQAAQCNFAELATLQAGLSASGDAMEAAARALDFEEALALAQALEGDLVAYEAELARLGDQKALYEQRLAGIRPRLDAAKQCNYPSLADMQAELDRQDGQMTTAAGTEDYETALGVIGDLEPNLGAYEDAFAKIEELRSLYDSRLQGLQSDLADVTTCEFEELGGQQQEIDQTRTRMEEKATSHDYEAALAEMDGLVSKLDDFKLALEEARSKRAYEELLAELKQPLADATVCNYGPLEDLAGEISSNHDAAQAAAAARDYNRGFEILTAVRPKLDDYAGRLAEIEQKKDEYDGRVAAVIEKFDAAAQCAYPQLSGDHETLIALRDEMEGAAGTGDYPTAVDAMNRLEAKLVGLEAALAELDAKRREYEERLPGLAVRLDGAMQCDFTELEDDRAAIEKGRADMEIAATASEFPKAVDHMNTLEQQLDALDTRVAELIDLKARYEAAFKALEEGLGVVERCDHAELAGKKAEITKLRDEMLVFATATDYGAALEKVTPLKTLVEAFLKLLKLREQYVRRHDLAKPRVEAARKFTYKSLADAKKKIDELYAGMTADAAKAAFEDALTKVAELEKKLTEIEEANERLKVDEIRYNDRYSILQPKAEAAKKSKVEKAEAEIEAVKKADEEMTGLAKEHKYTEAIEKAEALALAIEAYEKKLEKILDKKELYEAMKDGVLARLKEAAGWAKAFEKLAEDYKTANDLAKAMAEDAKKENAKYDEALAKLKELDGKIDDLEKKWLELRDAETAYKARSGPVIARFEALPDEAEDKANTLYGKAEKYLSEMKSEADDDDFAAAMEKLEKLEETLEGIDEKLKSGDELEAEYEGRMESLQPRLDKAAKPRWPEKLAEKKGAVDKAVAEMKKAAARKDFKGALELADAVDKALADFDEAEDKLEQETIRFEERLDGFEKRYDKATKLEFWFETPLTGRIKALKAKMAAAKEEAKAGKLDSALLKATEMRDEVDAILKEADRMVEEAKKAEEDDDGIFETLKDKAVDIAEDAVDIVIDEVKDTITGVPKTVMEIGENVKDVYDNVKDGEYLEAGRELVDVVDGVTDLAPGSGTVKRKVKKVKKAIEAIDVVGEVSDAYDTVKDYVSGD